MRTIKCTVRQQTTPRFDFLSSNYTAACVNVTPILRCIRRASLTVFQCAIVAVRYSHMTYHGITGVKVKTHIVRNNKICSHYCRDSSSLVCRIAMTFISCPLALRTVMDGRMPLEQLYDQRPPVRRSVMSFSKLRSCRGRRDVA
jgi:hypothetical protein